MKIVSWVIMAIAGMIAFIAGGWLAVGSLVVLMIGFVADPDVKIGND